MWGFNLVKAGTAQIHLLTTTNVPMEEQRKV